MIELIYKDVTLMMKLIDDRLELLEGAEKIGSLAPAEKLHTYLDKDRAGMSTIITNFDDAAKEKQHLRRLKALLESEIELVSFRFGKVDKETTKPTEEELTRIKRVNPMFGGK